MSKTLPISFCTEMVCAIRDGSKTQTRRPVKGHWQETEENQDVMAAMMKKCPWQVGDILWVRERARLVDFGYGEQYGYAKFRYEADGARSDWIKIPDRIKPIKLGNCVPNGCFKELARTWLKVTRVWAEQVQDISDEDCINEGCSGDFIFGGDRSCNESGKLVYVQFSNQWEFRHPGSWDKNDWIFGCEFEKEEEMNENKLSKKKTVKRGNVIYNKATNRKYVAMKDSELSENEEIVCCKAHEDGDFSYLCCSEYCKCYQ